MRLLCFLIFWAVASPLQAEILRVRVDGIIDPITAEFIQQSVEKAEDADAEFLLVELETPGGLGISMQEIVQSILNSEVPVVVYVTPSGAHAASAGFFILLSADIAAMAPGTNTGAAHPVFPGADNDKESVMLQKVRNDALASLRSITQRRQRNYEMAEKGVLESKSYTAQEALEGGLIDLTADSTPQLLEKLEGREVTRFSGDKQVIRTQGERVEELEMTLRQTILSTIANPNLAALLGMIGLIGLYVELTNPGLILPGVLGGISLLLSLLGFSLLPVNAIGVLLIVLALGLFVAEVLVQGFGILGVGGALAMVLGMLFLVETPYPSLRIGLDIAIALAVPFAIIAIFLGRLAIRSFRSKVTTGEAGLMGMIGVARSGVDQEGGTVFIHGELWKAYADTAIPMGSRVRVVRAQNLSLKVEPYRHSEFESRE